jgi:hypothetical protein
VVGSSPGSPVNTFVVRFSTPTRGCAGHCVWREWSAAGPRRRGSIEHAESRERGAFLDLAGLEAFLRHFGVVVPVGDKDRSPRRSSCGG